MSALPPAKVGDIVIDSDGNQGIIVRVERHPSNGVNVTEELFVRWALPGDDDE